MVCIDVEKEISTALKMKNRDHRPLPEIDVQIRSEAVDIAAVEIVEHKPQRDPEVPGVLMALEKEFRDLKIERAKISNKIFELYENGATADQQKQLYDEIKSFKPRMLNIYDQIRHIQNHGEIPKPKEDGPDPENLAALMLHKKKLSDLRYKLKKKLTPSAKPAGKAKILEWERKLAAAEIEYQGLDLKIKALQMNG